VVLGYIGESSFRETPSKHVEDLVNAESTPAPPQKPAENMTFSAEYRVLGSSSSNFLHILCVNGYL
jgi:hypothetical protein